MGFAIAGAVAAGGALSYMGASQSADAASSAAKSQQGLAAEWQKYVRSSTENALAQVGQGYTPASLAAYDTALSSQKAQVERQESLAAALNPALISAGSQLNQLLQGQSAPVLKNLQDQRQLQRQQLVSQLQQQMGPGAETSTAGAQALAAFDSQTANITSQAQQQYIQQLSQIPLSGSGVGQALTGENNALTNMQAQDPETVANTLKASIMMSGVSQSAGAFGAQVKAAGGQYAGDQIMGRATSQLGGSLIQGAGAFAGNRNGGGTPGQPQGAPGAQPDNTNSLINNIQYPNAGQQSPQYYQQSGEGYNSFNNAV